MHEVDLIGIPINKLFSPSVRVILCPNAHFLSLSAFLQASDNFNIFFLTFRFHYRFSIRLDIVRSEIFSFVIIPTVAVSIRMGNYLQHIFFLFFFSSAFDLVCIHSHRSDSETKRYYTKHTVREQVN